MNFRFLIVALITTVYPLYTALAFDCSSFIAHETHSKYQDYSARATKMINGIHEHLPQMAVPGRTGILIVPGFSLGGAQFFDFLSLIGIEMSLPAFPSLKINPYTSSVILSHEYGHALFYRNMDDYSDYWRNASKTKLRIYEQDLKSQTDEWIKFIIEADDKGHGSDPMVALYSSMMKERIDRVIDDSSHFGLGYIIMQEVSMPYQEVFADLVSTMETGSPITLTNILMGIGDSSVEVYRSFYSKVSAEGFVAPRSGPHHVLNPVRSLLWEGYFSKIRPDRKDQFGGLLQVVFKIFANDIVDRCNHILPLNTTDENLNLRLIKRLKEDEELNGLLATYGS